MSGITFDDFDSIALPGSNSRYKVAMCLWHDDGDTPGMLIYHDGFFKCLGCGAKGGWNKLYQRMHEVAGTTPAKRLGGGRLLPRLPKDLPGQVHLASEAHRLMLSRPELGWYLKARRLDDQVLPLTLGWWDGWITIPIQDRDGVMQGLVLRATPATERQYKLRFLTPVHQPAMLYVPDWKLLETEPAIFICFGMFDAPSLSKLGFASCTTTAGKDSFNPGWLSAYRKPIYAIGDVGETDAALRLGGGLDWRHRRLNLRFPAGAKDPNDFLKHDHEDDLYRQLNQVRQAVVQENQKLDRRLARRKVSGRAAAQRSL